MRDPVVTGMLEGSTRDRLEIWGIMTIGIGPVGECCRLGIHGCNGSFSLETASSSGTGWRRVPPRSVAGRIAQIACGSVARH
jgi:hypothetical protein